MNPQLTEPALASGWTDTDVSVRLRPGAGGTVRVEGVLCSAPVWFRWDGDTLWMVGSGASPVGDDHIRVLVDVGAGLDVTVRSVAATIVYAARGRGTRWDTEIRVGSGARVDWQVEPVILTGLARHRATTTVSAASDAEVWIDDLVVLGRSGEQPGTIHSTLSVQRGNEPVLMTSVDTSLPGWAGPAGTGGASVLGTRLHLGADLSPPERRVPVDVASTATLLEPGTGCRLAVGVADDVGAARRDLDAVLPR